MTQNYSVVIFICLLVTTELFAQQERDMSIFSGRISKIHDESGLMRVTSEFKNAKYLNVRDRALFWHESAPSRRCQAVLVGKSADYLLFRIEDFENCRRDVAVSWGQFMVFQSQDLARNLVMGQHLVQILLKRHTALQARQVQARKELSSHIERVNAVNMRYELLKAQLLQEWREEIAALNEDRSEHLRVYEDVNRRLAEIAMKLERYRQDDSNLRQDRWSLDSALYFKK